MYKTQININLKSVVINHNYGMLMLHYKSNFNFFYLIFIPTLTLIATGTDKNCLGVLTFSSDSPLFLIKKS